jgi:cell division protein FtsI (penicillin-binding protein 3)
MASHNVPPREPSDGARRSPGARPAERGSFEALLAAARRFARRPVTRTQAIGVVMGGCFAVMAGRLAYLQGIDPSTYAIKAYNEASTRKTLHHRRGTIYDRKGRVLAQSVEVYHVTVFPQRLTTRQLDVANILASELGLDAAAVYQKITADTSFDYVKKNVAYEVIERIQARIAEINTAISAQNTASSSSEQQDLVEGIDYETAMQRSYPMGELAGTTIGAMSSDGDQALSGLELQYDEILRGTDGYLIQEQSRSGLPVVGGESERVEPVDGTDIVVSLDADLHRVAQEAISGTVESWGAQDAMAIVMDPRTGELLVCTSTPYLDPAGVGSYETAAYNLKCVSSIYEPGSTAKPLVAAMAVELGLAGPDQEFDVPASVQVGDDEVSDVDDRDYDAVFTLTNILERSSNVGAVLVARLVGSANFASYLDRFGIGEKTGIDYPGEIAGQVSKLEDYTGAWASMAFGQGFAVPPVQMARAVGSLANGGVLTTPHFLVSKNGVPVDWGTGASTVSAATAETVAWMMNSVTVNGYGKPAAIDGYNISSKTGTAERASETGGYLTDQYLVSFIGFAPTEDPQALVYVLVDGTPYGGTGSTVAAPAWREIMLATLESLDVQPSW